MAAALVWAVGSSDLQADAKSLGFRATQLAVPSTGKTGFTWLPTSITGVTFTNTLAPARALANANLMNGSGVALGDYDGDGLCDIYLADLGGTNALYRNRGDWKFQDVTVEAGVGCPNQLSTGAVFADIDGDGDLDLLVTSMGGPNACFINDGRGHFTNEAEGRGLVSRLGSTSMALADIDGNGTLDLYVADYGLTSIIRSGGALNLTYVNGRPVVRGRYAQRIKIVDGMMFELGEPDFLYLNDGHGKFRPVSWTDGTFTDENGQALAEVPWDQGLSVIFHDINGDSFPDLYVCNDAFTPDRCWINDGRGHFRALGHLACRSTSYFSMGVDFADIDRDGRDDFLVVDMLSRQHRLALTQKGNMAPQPRLPGDIDNTVQMRRNTLFLNRGDGTYAEIANFSGIAASEWTWSGSFLDVDLDGWEDILICNGFLYNMDDADVLNRIRGMRQLTVAESRKMVLLFPPLVTPNLAFRNQHDRTFQAMGTEWGFDSLAISNGTAFADLDNDGDLDVVVNCLNGPALLYRNDCPAARIAIRLRGRAPNTQGIGARLKVVGGPVTQTAEVMCGGRYMSGHDPLRVFAAGAATNLQVEVTWRNGARSVLPDCAPNCLYEIDEAASVSADAAAGVMAARASPNENPRSPLLRAEAAAAPSDLGQAGARALFEDRSELLRHRHTEAVFDDFSRQPLLPMRLSQLGPGAGWFDFDRDGRDDLLISTGKGGHLAIYRNDPVAGFRPAESSALTGLAERDQTAVLGWVISQDEALTVVGQANYEDGSTNGQSVACFRVGSKGVQSLPGVPSGQASVGPLSLVDMDANGWPELFVGGRVIPGRYPEASSSSLYRFDGKVWQLDPANTAVLQKLGLVSGSVWSDLDGDGFPELIVACEWGPVRVFKNTAGQLEERTAQLGLSEMLGWWTGVATGDVDGDGDLDMVAANWGLNTPYQPTRQHPVRLYYGDWRGTGYLDVLEAYDEPSLGIVPRRDFGTVAAALPFLRERFSTFMAFAEANVASILGDKFRNARELHANTMASMLFINEGGRFRPVPLPAEAQFAPAFGVTVADFDGDGHEDLLLSQNFFATPPDAARYDAGRGLLLRGDGTGKLIPMSAAESGIAVYGEQRGAAASDYDADGRIDLALTQNGAETRLLHNARAHPGLRIRLQGEAGNACGVGAQVRLIFPTHNGPVREIHAGSGYWSQDSAVLVMGTPETPAQVWVRWPGGRITIGAVPKDAREIMIQANGLVIKSR
ncbi:MAG: VCBS repeat-containing protein [Verrucomicrobiota bacterium]